MAAWTELKIFTSKFGQGCNCLIKYNQIYDDSTVSHYWINADLKISPYVCVYMKIITWKFHILISKNSRVIHSKSLYFS